MHILKENKNYLFELDHFSIISVIGEKGIEFLQGQLTCDVKKIDATTMQSGAYCNLKGRVLTLLDVVAFQGLQIVVPSALNENIKRAFAKTALVSRVRLSDNATTLVYGFYNASPTDPSPIQEQLPETIFGQTISDDTCIYNVGENFYILLVPSDKKDKLCTPFLEKDQLLCYEEWHHLQVGRKRFEIYPNTAGLFLPHRLGLHKNGYISFDKGCYKGQEIIARTHYRATLKHSLQLFKIEANQAPIPGIKVFELENQREIGEVIDFSPISNNSYLVLISILIEHPLDVILEGSNSSIHLELPGGC